MNAPPNRFFAPGPEFARIERMFGADRFSPDGRGLGDDAFVWEPVSGSTWVSASDASAEGVHYRLDWTTPARALRKALLANLSDINAMGGRTRFAFFNLGAPADWNDATYDALGEALRALENAHGFRIAGGDTAQIPAGKQAGFFSFTVLGEVDGLPLLRSGARPGHRVYVSGFLGGSSAGLALFRAGSAILFQGDAVEATRFANRASPPTPEESPQESLLRAHLDPVPPLALGPRLASLQRADRSIAAIDISDGLSSELWHLARQSRCALRVDAEKIPAHPALAASGLDAASRLTRALHGGEEYQLLFTGEFTAEELDLLRSVTSLTEIGVVEAGEGVFLREHGKTRPLAAGGWSHGDSL